MVDLFPLSYKHREETRLGGAQMLAFSIEELGSHQRHSPWEGLACFDRGLNQRLHNHINKGGGTASITNSSLTSGILGASF